MTAWHWASLDPALMIGPNVANAARQLFVNSSGLRPSILSALAKREGPVTRAFVGGR